MDVSKVHIRLEDETLSDDQTQLHAYAVCLREFVAQSIEDTRTDSNERAKQQMQVNKEVWLHGLSIYARLRAAAIDCTSAATVNKKMALVFTNSKPIRGTILEPLNLDLKAHYTNPDVLNSQPNDFTCKLEFEVGSRQKKTQGTCLFGIHPVSACSCLKMLSSSHQHRTSREVARTCCSAKRNLRVPSAIWIFYHI